MKKGHKYRLKINEGSEGVTFTLRDLSKYSKEMIDALDGAEVWFMTADGCKIGRIDEKGVLRPFKIRTRNLKP